MRNLGVTLGAADVLTQAGLNALKARNPEVYTFVNGKMASATRMKTQEDFSEYTPGLLVKHFEGKTRQALKEALNEGRRDAYAVVV